MRTILVIVAALSTGCGATAESDIDLDDEDTEAASEALSGDNLLDNGGFEQPLANGWETYGTGDTLVARREGASKGDGYGLRIAEQGYGCAEQWVFAKPGVTYRLSAWVRHRKGAATERLVLSFREGTVEGEYKHAKKSAGESGDWHRITIEAKAPAWTKYIKVAIGDCNLFDLATTWDDAVYNWDAVALRAL